MKALILSCNTGAGHNACAIAVQEAIMSRGIPCDIRDGLSFLSKEASRFISEWHVRLYRSMPKLYGEGYFYAERRVQGMTEDSMLYRFLSLGAKSLLSCIQSQGYTHVLCTHLFPAIMLTELRRLNALSVITAFIATDYTASPGYEAVSLDWCFAPAPELAEQFINQNFPAGRVVPSGIPVSGAFRSPGDRAAAKRALGVDPEHRHLLVMSGSMGCGPLKRILRHLAKLTDESTEVSVICGTNRKLSRQLSHQFSDQNNIHIREFVDHVALFMDSADLYLTKPGGLSVTEALGKRLPMVLIKAVEGCETHNMRYCLEKGAAVTADDPRAVAELCVRLIRDRDALAAMVEAAALTRPGAPAVDTICDRMFGGDTQG